MMETQQKIYELDKLRPVKAQQQNFDLSEYDGVRSEIEIVEIRETDSVWMDGKQLPAGQTVKVKNLFVGSKVLGTRQITKSGQTVEIRAWERFNLVEDVDGAL